MYLPKVRTFKYRNYVCDFFYFTKYLIYYEDLSKQAYTRFKWNFFDWKKVQIKYHNLTLY